jgi:phenylpyruvate tautomerase PptA (4-oxalocrotonate tautomerase family)
MPIVHVNGLDGRDVQTANHALQHVAAAVADAADCPIEEVWCTLRRVDAMTVGERSIEWDGRIVYVDVFLRPRGEDASKRILERCSAAVAEAFDVPLVDVWARIVELPSGSVYAGGRLI